MPTQSHHLSAAFLTALLTALVCLPARAETPATALDFPKLKIMLDNMGYAVEDLKGSYQISEKRSGTTIFTVLAFSGDDTELWMKSYICTIDPATIPNAILIQMLKDNYTWGPVHFSLTPIGDKFAVYLNRAVDNHDLTPKLLRDNINNHVSAVVGTINTWDASKWPNAAAAPTK